MPRPGFRTVVAGLLLAATLVLGTGCIPFASYVATFGAGYLMGRLSASPVGEMTTERVCYQGGQRVACP